MNFKAPRGTHDIWGKQAENMQKLEQISRHVFMRYNFTEMRTPVFEDAGLFTRSIGETTDIVEKEMYVFTDRKGRKLALRPEGTASIVRACLENQLQQNLPVNKLFYIGSMFRYERPQAGRYREFYQIGAEYFANTEPSADAEIVLLARDILAAAGLKEIKVHINSLGCAKCRPAFRDSLTKYFSSKGDLCADCQRRIERNPLRVLDCKIDSPKFENIPHMEEHLCDECKTHFIRVKELLDTAECQYYIDHRLVRGLDYYTRTIFEVRSNAVGSQDALAAGGRYDNLVKELGGNQTPAVGFALGSERVLMALENLNIQINNTKIPATFIAVTSAVLEKEAFKLSAKLRNIDNKKENKIEGPFADKSLKSQLRLADKLGAGKVIIFGEEEFKKGAVTLRDMQTQEQKEITLAKILDVI